MIGSEIVWGQPHCWTINKLKTNLPERTAPTIQKSDDDDVVDNCVFLSFSLWNSWARRNVVVFDSASHYCVLTCTVWYWIQLTKDKNYLIGWFWIVQCTPEYHCSTHFSSRMYCILWYWTIYTPAQTQHLLWKYFALDCDEQFHDMICHCSQWTEQ